MAQRNSWLTPNIEDEETKAAHRRLAREWNMSLADVVTALEVEQAKQKRTAGPVVIAERDEPVLIYERPDPQVLIEPPAPRELPQPSPSPFAHKPLAASEPDPQLIELVKLYWRLSNRDRLELLYAARIKMHLNGKAQ